MSNSYFKIPQRRDKSEWKYLSWEVLRGLRRAARYV